MDGLLNFEDDRNGLQARVLKWTWCFPIGLVFPLSWAKGVDEGWTKEVGEGWTMGVGVQLFVKKGAKMGA